MFGKRLCAGWALAALVALGFVVSSALGAPVTQPLPGIVVAQSDQRPEPGVGNNASMADVKGDLFGCSTHSSCDTCTAGGICRWCGLDQVGGGLTRSQIPNFRHGQLRPAHATCTGDRPCLSY